MLSECPPNPVNEYSTLVELLRYRATHQAERLAYTFLTDGEVEGDFFTYGSLDRKARTIAAQLQALGVVGGRALLLFHPSLDFVAAYFGCLYAGVVAVPAYPPRPNRPMSRIQGIVADAEASVALTTAQTLTNIKQQLEQTPDLKILHWVATDSLDEALASQWVDPEVQENSLAFLQYTSGSTSTPKGVMVTHQNLLVTLADLDVGWNHTPDSVIVTWLPTFHDLGLIYGVLQPLRYGFRCYMMPPASFLQRPVRWLEAISRFRGTHTGAPNFAYDLCIRKITPEQRATLDLSSWVMGLNAAEPISPDTLQRFNETFAPCGLHPNTVTPGYGLAETTLKVSTVPNHHSYNLYSLSGSELEENRIADAPETATDRQLWVGCGYVALDTKVVIAHPEQLTRCAHDQVGEIWVSGSCVAQGYWRRPEETEKTFRAYLADTGEGPFLRTGDLGFIKNSEVCVTGRLKDLIIIGGKNHYPQDIERTVEEVHPAVKAGAAAAFTVLIGGEERLVVAIEIERTYLRNLSVEEAIGSIQAAISTEHDLQLYALALLKPGSIPKTSSGKIQRRACRAGFLDGSLSLVHQWSLADGAAETEKVTAEVDSALTSGHSLASIQQWLITHISELLGVAARALDAQAPFARYGMNSLLSVSLTGDIQDWLGRKLSPTLTYDYPTIASLARHLAGEADTSELPQAKEQFSDQHNDEHIAIIGIGCRFPGGAHDPMSFWKLLCEGVDAVKTVPIERWDAEAFYDADFNTPGKIVNRVGGFLGQIDQFDPYFWGLSAQEATSMDPQQRLMLEVTKEALDDGGQPMEQLAGSQTGVFIGLTESEYTWLSVADHEKANCYTATGNFGAVTANRISYLLDLRGPSFTVDAVCSSSLLAVHLACQSLISGECNLALAGGSVLLVKPDTTLWFSKLGVLSPDGQCRAFDHRASGIALGEGVATVVLKRLSEAQRDNDPIYGVIRGSAVAQDGRTNGLTAPSRLAQEQVLREAYRKAGLQPNQVHYVEGHGTGTKIGDPIEAQALGTVVGQGRTPENPCYIGSVKTNLGHLSMVGGLASLIKVALSVKHRLLPPSLHFEAPNPLIPMAELGLKVAQTLIPWPSPERAIAGVTALSFGGTNVHLVVEEPPTPTPVPEVKRTAYILPLSTHSPEALQDLVRAYQILLKDIEATSLYDLCYTASARRSHYDYRLSAVFRSLPELSEQLTAFLQQESQAGLTVETKPSGQPRRVVFVFSGHGSQWLGMGRDLMVSEPIFRATLERCDQELQPYLGWSIIETLQAPEGRLDAIEVVQPLLFAIQIALAHLWQERGIQPDAVVGHSMGEVAAAHIAGVLSLSKAARLMAMRSQLLQRLSGLGGSALVELDLEACRAFLAPYAGLLTVAVSNSPRATVISGEPKALTQALQSLEAQDIFCRRIKVDVALHSPQTAPLAVELKAQLALLQPQLEAVPIYSTVTGKQVSGLAFDGDYWGRNLRETVLFTQAVQQLVSDGYTTFLEISPHPVLVPAIEQTLRQLGQEGVAIASLRRDVNGEQSFLNALSRLWALGCTVRWKALYPLGGQTVRLPLYPWQRERFWLDEPTGALPIKAGHPILGEHLELALQPGVHLWNLSFDAPFLQDHGVQGQVVLPAAAYVELVLAATQEAFGAQTPVLEAVNFIQMLPLPAHELPRAQLILTHEHTGQVNFQCLSQQEEGAWTIHATGIVRLNETLAPSPIVPLAAVRNRCLEEITAADHYQRMALRGAEYGSAFQGVSHILRRDGEALGQLELGQALRSESGRYQLHPALLDACIQVAFSTQEDAKTYLPVGFEHLCRHTSEILPATGYCHITARPPKDDRFFTVDLLLSDESGAALLEIQGLRFQNLQNAARSWTEYLFDLDWQLQPLPPTSQSQIHHWLLFVPHASLELSTRLTQAGAICTLVFPGESFKQREDDTYEINPSQPEDFQRLLQVVGPCHHVVHLWGLGEQAALSPEMLVTQRTLGAVAVLHLVQALVQMDWSETPRLWLVTQYAQGLVGTLVNPSQTMLWGLARTIAQEHPELQCTCLDVDDPIPQATLVQELLTGSSEDQVALRGEKRYVARLIESSLPASVPLMQAGTQRFRLELAKPGILDQLTLQAVARRDLAPHEVEIEVVAAGLNFLDVVRGLGLVPGLLLDEDPVQFGMECSGRISALGTAVTGLAVGDAVIAVVSEPACFSTHVYTPQHLVVQRPETLTFEAAAALPIVFVTAYYALHILGRMRQGERILIHAAAGGVGLAAVQLGQQVGAEIFATAGSPEKREFLKNLGVQHVMDSRSLDFAETIMTLTDGEGVDIVLNSLSGEALTKSLEVLAPFGRFLEIGKRDIYDNRALGLWPFQKNLSYSALDLVRIFRDCPELSRELLQAMVTQLSTGKFVPLPTQVFPITAVQEAFRHMSQARHIGKVVVSLQESAKAWISPSTALRADATYLVTGGLGGLGLTVAQWLVAKGARHVVLAGRKAPSTKTEEAVTTLRNQGAEIYIAIGDISKEVDAQRILTEIRTQFPPLHGVFHCAGVLNDGILLQQNEQRFAQVMAPKVEGSWHLHHLTLDQPLDYFVLFSSTAALLGAAGQGNYATANAFLDGLAYHRRALGLPAVSINWGPWATVGGVVELGVAQTMERNGLASLEPETGIAILAQLLIQSHAQVMVANFDAQRWALAHPGSAQTLLANLGTGNLAPTSHRENTLRQALISIAPGLERRALLEEHLRNQAAQVLGMVAERIDVGTTSFGSLGFDSLRALELRNRLENSLDLTLPATLVWNFPTFSTLADYLASKLAIPLEESVTEAQVETEQASTEEMARLLSDKLATLRGKN